MKVRRGFLITVSTAGTVACAGLEPPEHKNPPALIVTATSTAATGELPVATDPPPPPPSATGPIDFAAYTRELNPKDAKNRTIKLSFDGTVCLVELPFKTPPTSVQEPPTERVACPAELRDPAWKACNGGSMMTNAAGTDCVCYRFGNPPPPPERVACPKKK